MAVAFLETAAGVGDTDELTKTITINGSCDFLLVGIHYDNDNATVSSVTFDGNACTHVTGSFATADGGAGDNTTDLWYYENPSGSSKDVVVTLSAGEAIIVNCMQFSGTDAGGTPIGAVDIGGGDGDSDTLSIGSMASGDLAVMCESIEDGDDYTAEGTVLYTDESNLPNNVGRSAADDPTATFDVGSDGQWSASAVRLIQAATAVLTVTTQAATSIAGTTATGNGNITDVGAGGVDEKGFVYDTSTYGDPGDVSPAASSYGSVENDSPGPFSAGAYTDSITGLSDGVLYYCRAYAHGTDGYAYGAEVSFTTDTIVVTTQAASAVVIDTATGNGNITDAGDGGLDEKGFVYETSSQSLPGDVSPAASTYGSVENETGSFSVGAYTDSLTGLTAGQIYYMRAYAHGTNGYSYGEEVNFTMLTPPTVTTEAASSVDGTSATGNGTVTDDGSP